MIQKKKTYSDKKKSQEYGMKNRAELLLNFLLRAVFGMIAIYLVNSFLQGRGLEGSVGINPLSFLTSGILGFPGVALLYGINFYFIL